MDTWVIVSHKLKLILKTNILSEFVLHLLLSPQGGMWKNIIPTM
jgi:hypothetical protein